MREGYLWKSKANHRACDPDWTAFQMGDFQALYDRRFYDLAKNNLKYFVEACASSLAPEAKLRAYSDLSVTEFHLGDRASCLKYVRAARETPGSGSAKSKAAILHNESLCRRAKANAKIELGDVAWLLGKGAGDATVLYETSVNPKFEALLTKTVPGLDFMTAQFDGRAKKWATEGILPAHRRLESHQSFNLRGAVRANLLGPEFKLTADGGRFAKISGCMEHSCTDRGMIWVDSKRKLSAFAINDFAMDDERSKTCFAIGSRTAPQGELPPEFYAAFTAFKKESPIQSDCAVFIDGTGQRVTVQAFAGQ